MNGKPQSKIPKMSNFYKMAFTLLCSQSFEKELKIKKKFSILSSHTIYYDGVGNEISITFSIAYWQQIQATLPSTF